MIDCCLMPSKQIFQLYVYLSMRCWWSPLCTRPTCWVGILYNSASSLKQQSSGRHVAPYNLISSQPVLALTPYCCLLREAAKTKLTFFGLTRQGLEPTNYCTWGKHTNHQCGCVMQTEVYTLLLCYSQLSTINIF